MAESMRPYRDLCPDAERRDAMSDGDYWTLVAQNLGLTIPDDLDEQPDMDQELHSEPCSICGETGACAFDAEGRPMIHAQEYSDD